MPNTIAPPNERAPHIRNICASINAKGRVLRMPIEAEADCKVRECFNNVSVKVQRDGGRVVYGWTIWEWPNVYVEAAHHAVYAPSRGHWRDITPADDGDTERVFLEDGAADKSDDVRRRTIRFALSKSPLVLDFLKAAEATDDILFSQPIIDGMQTFPATIAGRIQGLNRVKENLIPRIGMTHTAPNAKCWCESGAKFKKCHGA